ncbi:hypothetical protein ACFUMH_04590 [Cellulomonas sp. NPDC057328]|uniref:hypothetical protein n=1 Tax=Cellulomonas sp. NPDC057328 TaxID=3346101 RepID=UPI0036413371
MDEQRTSPEGVPPEDVPTDGAVPDGAVQDGAVQDGAVQGGADAALPPSVQALEEVVGARGVDATQHAQELLAEHVPLALLVDLLTPTGDTSADLLAAEGLPDDPWWQDGDDASAGTPARGGRDASDEVTEPPVR